MNQLMQKEIKTLMRKFTKQLIAKRNQDSNA